jgi:hypothetical protein
MRHNQKNQGLENGTKSKDEWCYSGCDVWLCRGQKTKWHRHVHDGIGVTSHGSTGAVQNLNRTEMSLLEARV